MHIYSSCIGSLFISENELSYEDTYCETCGDTDGWLGEIKTRKQLIKLLKQNNYYEKYIDEFVNEVFN